MSLRDQITSDMRDAMRAHDKEKLSALRMLLSSIKQKEVDEQITADDAVIQQIIAKLIKQRPGCHGQSHGNDQAEGCRQS